MPNQLFDEWRDYLASSGIRIRDVSPGRLIMEARFDNESEPNARDTRQRPDAWLANVACIALTAVAATVLEQAGSIALASLTVEVFGKSLPKVLVVDAAVRGREGDIVRCEASFRNQRGLAATASALIRFGTAE